MAFFGFTLAQVLLLLGGAAALTVALHMLRAHHRRTEVPFLPLWERVLQPDPSMRVTLPSYQVPDSWRWVIEQVNGEQTVGALFARCARQSGLDEEDAMRAIFLGVTCKMFEAA